MEFLKVVAIQQAVVWAVFSIVAVAGAFALRRWGGRASLVVRHSRVAKFEVDAPGLGRCAFKHVRPRDNVISVDRSTLPELRRICYGEGAQDAELTLRFVGSETSLILRGPIVKGGEYYFYDSL